jgi:hypothetical protein
MGSAARGTEPLAAAACCHCGDALPAEWLKSKAASLMGRTTGGGKARTSEIARKAARARWGEALTPEERRQRKLKCMRDWYYKHSSPKKRRKKRCAASVTL